MRVFRNIILSSIIFCIIGSTLSVPLIYADFEIRRDYIAKVLCVERDNPITICKGSCYLTTNLQKAAEHEKQTKNTNPIQELVFFLTESNQTNDPVNTPFVEFDHPIVNQVGKEKNIHLDVFRPPQS